MICTMSRDSVWYRDRLKWFVFPSNSRLRSICVMRYAEYLAFAAARFRLLFPPNFPSMDKSSLRTWPSSPCSISNDRDFFRCPSPSLSLCRSFRLSYDVSKFAILSFYSFYYLRMARTSRFDCFFLHSSSFSSFSRYPSRDVCRSKFPACVTTLCRSFFYLLLWSWCMSRLEFRNTTSVRPSLRGSAVHSEFLLSE